MKKFKNIMFPLAVFAFAGPSVGYVSMLFSRSNRWAFLLPLFVTLVFNRRRIRIDPLIMFSLFLYATWGMTTVLWSDAFELSLLKSLAFVAVAFTFMLAGSLWVSSVSVDSIFDYLAIVAFVVFGASVLGYFFSPYAYTTFLYQGFVRGSNMLGFFVFMSFPFFMWKIYRLSYLKHRLLFVAMSVGMFAFLFMSYCRASILSVAVLIISFMYFDSIRKFSKYLVVIFSMFILLLAFNPKAVNDFVYSFVYKKSNDLLYTRTSTWGESYKAAQMGGFWGAGFGVSIGADEWKGGLSSVGYGREKGNSQLAIIEETGAFGFFLYILMILTILHQIFNSIVNADNKEKKAALAICAGAIIGFIVNSLFEGWWVAPGSTQSVAFWSVVGVSSGLIRLPTKDQNIENTH